MGPPSFAWRRMMNLLTLYEIAAILTWLHHRRRRGRNYRLNCAIFRLACCCGLQVSEICALKLGRGMAAASLGWSAKPYVRFWSLGKRRAADRRQVSEKS